jgi:hypothetical protein
MASRGLSHVNMLNMLLDMLLDLLLDMCAAVSGLLVLVLVLVAPPLLPPPKSLVPLLPLGLVAGTIEPARPPLVSPVEPIDALFTADAAGAVVPTRALGASGQTPRSAQLDRKPAHHGMAHSHKKSEFEGRGSR